MPELLHLAGQLLSGAMPAAIRSAARAASSIFRLRSLVSYRNRPTRLEKCRCHKAMARHALRSMPKWAAHSAGSITGDCRIRRPTKCPPVAEARPGLPGPARSVLVVRDAWRLERVHRPAVRDDQSRENKFVRRSRSSRGCGSRQRHGKPAGRRSGSASDSRPDRGPRRNDGRLHPRLHPVRGAWPADSASRRKRAGARAAPGIAACCPRGSCGSSRRAARNRARTDSRSSEDVAAGRNERFGSKPASLAGGRISIGSAPTRSA